MKGFAPSHTSDGRVPAQPDLNRSRGPLYPLGATPAGGTPNANVYPAGQGNTLSPPRWGAARDLGTRRAGSDAQRDKGHFLGALVRRSSLKPCLPRESWWHVVAVSPQVSCRCPWRGARPLPPPPGRRRGWGRPPGLAGPAAWGRRGVFNPFSPLSRRVSRGLGVGLVPPTPLPRRGATRPLRGPSRRPRTPAAPQLRASVPSVPGAAPRAVLLPGDANLSF